MDFPAAPIHVSLRCGSFYSGGTLSVEPGVVKVRPDRFNRALSGIDHTGWSQPTIHVVRPRIRAPWISTGIVLDMDCVAIISFFEWPPMKEALERAGFEICEHRTLVRLKVKPHG